MSAVEGTHTFVRLSARQSSSVIHAPLNGAVHSSVFGVAFGGAPGVCICVLVTITPATALYSG